jgi:hypothetical protein
LFKHVFDEAILFISCPVVTVMIDRLLIERRRKIDQEIEIAVRIKQLGLHPLDVLDDMFHTMIVLRKAALKKEYPGATDDELVRMMQEEVARARIYERHAW